MDYMVERNLLGIINVFVEDDSFICTENLIYQASLLYHHSIQTNIPIPSLRTGTRMYDGYDDSSTIISSDLVRIFHENYGNKINCDHVVYEIMNNKKPLSSFAWMSWGNSWISSNCDWKRQIEAIPAIKVRSCACSS